MEARRDGTGTSSAGLFRVSGAARSAIKGSWCWPGWRTPRSATRPLPSRGPYCQFWEQAGSKNDHLGPVPHPPPAAARFRLKSRHFETPGFRPKSLQGLASALQYGGARDLSAAEVPYDSGPCRRASPALSRPAAGRPGAGGSAARPRSVTPVLARRGRPASEAAGRQSDRNRHAGGRGAGRLPNGDIQSPDVRRRSAPPPLLALEPHLIDQGSAWALVSYADTR